MASLLLDTTVLIDALRGGEAAGRIRLLRRHGDRLFTSAVNVEEIVRGLRSGEQAAARRLFAGLRIAPLGAREGRQAGTWRREFADRGVTLHQADCLIAAATVGMGGRLATANVSDFPMTELYVEHWPSN